MPGDLFVFVDVDTQRDFLDPEGSLFIPGSGRILATLGRLTSTARKHDIVVIATACAHTPDEEEPEPFPPHCLVGTPGQGRIAETDRPGGIVLAPDARLDADHPPPRHLMLEKTRYDIFSRPDAAAIFARYGEVRPTFAVYGVATDYCVRAAVLGLRRLGHDVAVVADSVWAIDRDREAEQFADFVAAGATLTVCDVICGSVEKAAGLSIGPFAP